MQKINLAHLPARTLRRYVRTLYRRLAVVLAAEASLHREMSPDALWHLQDVAKRGAGTVKAIKRRHGRRG